MNAFSDSQFKRMCHKKMAGSTKDGERLFITIIRRKSLRILSYSGPRFPAFGLNTERYCEKCPNADTFYTVLAIII